MGRSHITYETIRESGLANCRVVDEFEKTMMRVLTMPKDAPAEEYDPQALRYAPSLPPSLHPRTRDRA